MFPKLYKVKSPDGNMLNIEGPEGASEAEVIAKAQELSNNYWNMEAYYKGRKAVYNVNLNAPTVPVMRDGKQVDTLYKVTDKDASFNPEGLFVNQNDKTKGIEFNLNDLKNNDAVSKYIQNNVFQGKLGDILNHPKLYKDYPFLKNLPIKLINQDEVEEYAYAIVNSDNDGPYISITANAFLNKDDKETVMETILHEAQHIIDYYENPYTASMTRNAEEIAEQVETDYVKDTKKIIDNKELTRNVRNNNLGNIKLTGDKWQGMVDNPNENVFVTFETPELGVRATTRVIKKNLKVTNSYEEYVNRYASEPNEKQFFEKNKKLMPHLENYAKQLAESQGVDTSKPNWIKQKPTNVNMLEWIKATAKAEGNAKALTYFTDEIIKKGIKMEESSQP